MRLHQKHSQRIKAFVWISQGALTLSKMLPLFLTERWCLKTDQTLTFKNLKLSHYLNGTGTCAQSFDLDLHLSLAIANMASGSMKIESLFIDEGFGTLDASSLHMVMNALDQLQNQGRKVVLISHIQEMHERIPVQIQVKALGAGASTIQVVG